VCVYVYVYVCVCLIIGIWNAVVSNFTEELLWLHVIKMMNRNNRLNEKKSYRDGCKYTHSIKHILSHDWLFISFKPIILLQ
jgi:hypothetical protein